MLIYKRSILAVVLTLSSLTAITSHAATVVIHSFEFPAPKAMNTQAKPTLEVKECKNDKDCLTLQTQNTNK